MFNPNISNKYSSTTVNESLSGILKLTSSCAILPKSVDSSSCSPQHGAFLLLFESYFNKFFSILNPLLLTRVSDSGMSWNLRSAFSSTSCSPAICNARRITSVAIVNGLYCLKTDERQSIQQVNNASSSVCIASTKKFFCLRTQLFMFLK